MTTYIMSHEMYQSLSHVRGFINMNGNSYQEHICIILSNLLTSDQKESIINTETYTGALNLITSYGILWSHEMQ